MLKQSSKTRVYVGRDIRIIPSQNRITKNGEETIVPPKVMQLLILLYSAQGETVSKQQLIEAIWPDIIVGQESLANVVTRLRRALNDSAKQSTYIETVQGIGYRWIGEIEEPSFILTSRQKLLAVGSVCITCLGIYFSSVHFQPVTQEITISDLKVTPNEKGVEIAVGFSSESSQVIDETAMLEEIEKITGASSKQQRIKIVIDDEPTID